MSRKTVIIGACIFVLLVLAAIDGLSPLWRHLLLPPPVIDPTPKIAGQNLPESTRKIDFEKRYDLYCKLGGPNITIFRTCKILGFTGEVPQQGGGAFSSGGARRYFEGCVVLELTDGRLAYIPPGHIEYFEEAAPKQ